MVAPAEGTRVIEIHGPLSLAAAERRLASLREFQREQAHRLPCGDADALSDAITDLAAQIEAAKQKGIHA